MIETALGRLTLVADGARLCGMYFPGHWTRPDRASFGVPSVQGFEEAAGQLEEYLVGTRRTFDLPTVTAGEAFDERVWALLREIPYGATIGYGDLARELGDARLARAVGGAVGRNPLSVIVPCHRVLGAGGALTGYAGGLRRKRFLLDLEVAHSPDAVVAPLFAPCPAAA